MKEKGFSLFEVAVFLIVLSLVMVSFYQAQAIEKNYSDEFNVAQTIKKYTLALDKYLSDSGDSIDVGVQNIPMSKLVQSGLLGENVTNSIGRYKIYLYAQKKVTNNTESVSGLVTAKSSTDSDENIRHIEGLLGRFGGIKDNGVVNGNWGTWVLDLNEWSDARHDQIFSFIPRVFSSSAFTSAEPIAPEINRLVLEQCDSGNCSSSTFHFNQNDSFSWFPLYTDDFFRIIPLGNKNFTFYKVSITYSGSYGAVSYVETAKESILLTPDMFSDMTSGDILVSILPASSKTFGVAKKLIIHKKVPTNILDLLWSSVDISIYSDDPGEDSFFNEMQYNCGSDNFLSTRNGKLVSVVFVPKNYLGKIIFDIEFSFFGNSFLFRKDSSLALSYYYDNAHYPWFFVNHKKYSGYIDSCLFKESILPRSVSGAFLKIGDKIFKADDNFRMTPWDSISHIMHINYYP